MPTTQSAPISPRPTINALVRECYKSANLDDGLPIRSDNRTAKVLSQLAKCRHGELGARRHDCPQCGSKEVTINACHDRHCPLCAKQSRYVWETQVFNWSLDCDYLHLVLTLPHEFNPLVAANPGPLLRLLQSCARDAVCWLARRQGVADPGLILVLHTWGQRLNHHFHVHTVMTSGGLSKDHQSWIAIDQDLLASQQTVLAARFKQLYLRRLKRLLSKKLFNQPVVAGPATVCASSLLLRYPLEQPDRQSLEKMLAVAEAKNWIADIGVTPKEFRDRGQLKNSIRYVGAYVAGSAIGDGRLVSQQGDRVTFSAFDYRTEKYINLEMTKLEFVQAFARHILPRGMRRVRFVGLFRPKGRPARLDLCRELIQKTVPLNNQPSKGNDTQQPKDNAVTDDNEKQLKTGVFCSQCQTKMDLAVEIDGSMSGWMLNVSMLVVAWLCQQRSGSLPIACDAESIAVALKAVVDRLQDEAWQRDAGRSLELSRCAGVTLGDLFYNEAHHQFMLILIVQQIAKQQEHEDRLAERMSTPNRTTTRGPPTSNFELRNSNFSRGSLKVQS